MAKRMNLGFDVSYIAMDGRWRMPGSWPGGLSFPDVEMYEDIARLCERGCFDMVFSGEGTGIPSTWKDSIDTAVEWGMTFPRQDLNPLMVAMSRVTKHVGYGITYASTFMHPYYIARLMNSLDHITNGRMALNVVTSTRLADAQNFGFDQLMEHGARYDRMDEFIDVCLKLWDSVAPDAMIWDRETGRVADPTKVRPIDHVGRFFKVKGPLNTPPSPQGRPVLVQAGGSPRGLKTAAGFVDIAFGENMAVHAQVKQRAALDDALRAHGRDPGTVGIMWQKPLVVAETGAEARRRREGLLTMFPPEGVGVYLSHNSGFDFSKIPERFTLKELNDQIAATQATPAGPVAIMSHKYGATTEMTRDEFFREAMRYASHYDLTFAGDGKEVADHLEEVFEATGSRGGFMIGHPISMPGDLQDMVAYLIPELQRRGRHRTAYRGRTLRETMKDVDD
ncbi:MAG TPA: NtaA/DmoA family FMN-dependent monooxygenase [Geminicoccus sp.]|jgi:FMN-dependent oxidoreductase (nitrilotriacetate monooxygenase family)|uniref:NtaA/DmoA family FMN-dependent monooxygenase n=1 Tax=Geminicoccus sp. TaxID=2024832 RepID=UPI002E30884C|nr:NtaA/DmoA family FMN-dependent monooxygenase [Geminicoccus sp.]HEX2528313.1 NtaA/DmoA family FMN-dependent monooxygenase [Geminicoccus sp.]